MRPENGLADGLCGNLRGVQTHPRTIGSLLSQRNPRPGKPHQRKPRRLDLGPAETEAAFADRDCGGRDLLVPMRLSGMSKWDKLPLPFLPLLVSIIGCCDTPPAR